MLHFSRHAWSPQAAFYLFKGGYAFSFTLMATIFSLYHIQTAHLNPLQLIVVGAVLEGTCFLLEIPTGVVADMYSRKLSLILGVVIMGVGLAVEGLFPTFAIILGAQMIWGAGATFLSGTDVAWLTDEVGPDKVQRVLVRGMQLYQLCSILGIVASVALAQIHLQVPMVASGLALLVLGLLLLVVMPETGFKPERAEGQSVVRRYLKLVARGFGHLRSHPTMIPFFIVVWLGGLYSEGIDRLWVLRLTDEIGLASLPIAEIYWFAIIQIVLLFLNFGAMRWVERRIDIWSHKTLYGLMALNNLVLLAALLGFALVNTFYAALFAFWVLMVARGTNDPLITIIVNDSIKDSSMRATVLSMKGLADQIGQVLGGLCVGFIALRVTVSLGLLASSVVLVVIVFMLGYLWRREPVSEQSQ